MVRRGRGCDRRLHRPVLRRQQAATNVVMKSGGNKFVRRGLRLLHRNKSLVPDPSSSGPGPPRHMAWPSPRSPSTPSIRPWPSAGRSSGTEETLVRGGRNSATSPARTPARLPAHRHQREAVQQLRPYLPQLRRLPQALGPAQSDNIRASPHGPLLHPGRPLLLRRLGAHRTRPTSTTSPSVCNYGGTVSWTDRAAATILELDAGGLYYNWTGRPTLRPANPDGPAAYSDAHHRLHVGPEGAWRSKGTPTSPSSTSR